MFKLQKVVSLSLAMFFASSIVPSIPLFNNKVSAATTNVATIDPSLQYQTMDGWGTSLAWWAKLVGEWKTNAKNEIMDLTFDPDKGLGLNMVRYNIGGSKSPNDTNLRPGGDVESYQLENGTYDWTKDAGQRWVLDQAKKKIAANEFKAEAFSNSPPYFMTISDQSSGNTGGISNLKPDQFQNFSDYLTKVVQHFESDYGITFDTIDPMNEPSTHYWKKGGNQEGCDFDAASEKDTIFQELSKNFNNGGITTKLAGFDETGIDYSFDTIKSADTKTIGAMSQFNAHVYSDGSRTRLRDFAASLGKPLYMDEICTSGGAKHDANDMDNGLKLADYIFKDLRDMKTPGWDIWQVVDDEAMNQTNNSNWGLISSYWSGDNVEKYFITKQYYAMAHFSKFIRPGYKIIDANNSNVVAAIDPTSQNLVLVTRNTSENDEPLILDVSKFDTTGATIKAYRTSGTESLADVSSSGVSLTNGTLKDKLPAKSMVTYVVSNAKYSGEIGTTINDNVIGNNDNQLQYSDSWGYYNAQSGAYSKDTHYSNTTDSYYQIKFKGNRIKIYGSFASDSGIAGISIDGGAETNVDLYSATRKDNALMYMSPLLGETEHTVKVRVTGNKNDASSDVYVGVDRVVAVQNSKDDAVVQNSPQLTQLTAGYNSLYTKYNDAEGATSYNVKYGTTPENYTEVINNVTDTSYLITGLENGIKYYVAVSAVINGQESKDSNELAETPISPTNLNLLYYVNCGDASPNVLENDEVLGTNNSSQDQAYGLDSLTKYNWGYIADGDKQWSQDTEAAVGSNYGCERQYDGSTPQGGLTYKFDVPNGKYNVTMGFYDPWNHKERLEDILINGNVVAQELCPTTIGKVPNEYVADVNDGILTVRAQKSIKGNDKPLISWIKVTKATTNNVRYNANGGEGTVPTDAINYKGDDIVTVKANTLAKAGYIFVGWNTATDGSGINYDPIDSNNNTLIIGDSDVTLYAQWKANTVQVTTPAAVAVEIIRDDDTLIAILKDEYGSECTTDAAVKYEWYRDTELVEGKNSGIYNLSNVDKGTSIKVEVPQYGLKSKSINIPEDPTDPTEPTEPTQPGDSNNGGSNSSGGSSSSSHSSSSSSTNFNEVVKTDTAKVVSSLSVELGIGVTTDETKEVTNIDGNKLSVTTLSKDGKFVGAVIVAEKESAIATIPVSLASGKVTAVYKYLPLLGKYIQLTEGVAIGTDSIALPVQANATYLAATVPMASTEIVTQGWAKIADSWYLVNATGDPKTGWQKDNTGWVYLSPSNGIMQIGWNKQGETWYHLNLSGYMSTGWVNTNDKWYYLNADGSMASNTKIDGYTVDSNGAWIE